MEQLSFSLEAHFANPSRSPVSAADWMTSAGEPLHPLAPLFCQAAAARSASQGRPLGRRPGALPLKGASTVAGWIHAGRMMISAAVLCLPVFPTATALAQSMDPNAQPPRGSETGSIDAYVSEAAQRFDIPATWIRAVMQVESGGDASAVSPKGALGLMQLMPATYADMRIRYGLGVDPMQPHDNIVAGAAYLREMLDCYGMAGFLAAYNAGPAQYDAHLATGLPLPAETRAYVAQLLPVIEGERNSVLESSSTPARNAVNWMRAPLFAIASAESIMWPSDGGANATPAAFHVQPARPSESDSIAGLTPSRRMLNGMFVPVSGRAGSR